MVTRMLSSWRRRGSRRAGALRKLPNRTYHSRPPAASHGFQRERRHSGTYPSTSACRCGSKTAAASGGKRPMDEQQDTFPRLLLQHARSAARPSGDAREGTRHLADAGRWAQVADEVRALACGLAAQGFKRGEHLAIVGDNRPRLYWAMLAAQALGGVPVPLYQDAPAAEFVYVAERRGDRLRDRRGPGAGRQAARGARRSARRSRTSITTIRAACATTRGRLTTLRARCSDGGREFDRAHPGFFDARGRARAAPTTSRRCSTPRAPPASRRACARRTRAFIDRARRRRRVRPARPPTTRCWPTCRWRGSADHLFSLRAVAGRAASRSTAPSRRDTVMTDLREIGPTYYFAPPRVFENLLTQVMIRMEDAGRVKRALFHHFMARRAPRAAPSIAGRQAGRRCSTALHYALGNAARLRRRCATCSACRACASPTPRARRSAPTCSASTARSAST